MLPRPRRHGYFNGAWLAFLASVIVLGGLIVLLVWDPKQIDERTLTVYCAAGIKPPVEAIARAYEDEYGVQVQLIYGGSETILTNAKVSERGDLFIPADDFYIDKAREQKLVVEDIALAQMTPVLAVPKGNPKKLSSLKDLLEKKITLVQANPDAAAIGLLTRKALRKTGQWDALHQRTRSFKGTVNDVANDIKVGTADAGIVWDATVRQYPELEMLELTELKNVHGNITAGVLTSCEHPAAALRFARYLSARDRGLATFKEKGYTPVDGDTWDDGEPVITIYSGAMLRPAIEETISAFAEREGIPSKNIRTVYNGCGILVGQMQAGQRPDAYFACDSTFMTQVKDLFLDDVPVSTNRLVILVHKGNPQKIASLRDLTKRGMRVGVGHEQQCAMGALTQETLKQGGVSDPVNKNVVVRSPTGDLLVNQMLAAPSSLDAVIAYISNAAKSGDRLEAIGIDVRCAIATQPIAVGRESQHKHLTSRLMKALLSAESRQRFESNGFRWKATAR